MAQSMGELAMNTRDVLLVCMVIVAMLCLAEAVAIAVILPWR
jgi:hypothetical protein